VRCLNQGVANTLSAFHPCTDRAVQTDSTDCVDAEPFSFVHFTQNFSGFPWPWCMHGNNPGPSTPLPRRSRNPHAWRRETPTPGASRGARGAGAADPAAAAAADTPPAPRSPAALVRAQSLFWCAWERLPSSNQTGPPLESKTGTCLRHRAPAASSLCTLLCGFAHTR